MDIHESHRRVRADLEVLRQWIPRAATRAASVSAWSIGEHCSHVLRLNSLVLERMRAPTPADTDLTRAGFVARAILMSGRIPRGIARAPESVQPSAADVDSLTRAADRCHEALVASDSELDGFARDPGLLRHPMLGGLTRTEWMQLMAIHQRHHLAIIDDMVGASA